MQRLAALAALLPLLLWPFAALAETTGSSARSILVASWVEEWDPVAREWVRVSDEEIIEPPRRGPELALHINSPMAMKASAARFAVPMARHEFHAPRRQPKAIASYGPFVVLDERRAAVMGSTDSGSVRAFDAMMRDFPGLEVLELVEAPGTNNDLANLAVGRRVRQAGLSTYVPRTGSVRSGAVELFLAGAERTVADGAKFAVHSWLDNYGREPDDFPLDAPANRLYLDYYVEMGMSRDRAESFYAMTNSVPHHSARWFGAEEMRFWLRDEETNKDGSVPKAMNVSLQFAHQAPIALPFQLESVSSMSVAMPLVAIEAPVAPVSAPRIAVQPMLQYADRATFALLTLSDPA